MSSVVEAQPLVELRGLVVSFPVRSGVLQRTTGWVQAVAGIDLTIGRGETLALVGESGCGKSTTGLAAMGLVPPTAGSVVLEGTDLSAMSPKQARHARRRMQMVFQDPTASLNSRMSVGQLVAEPLIVCTHAQTPEAILAPKTIAEADLTRCRELGATLAAGLALGIF